MTVADVIEYAKYGELAQLGVVIGLKSTDSAEVVEAEKQILSYINLGLVELYKRFDLSTKEVVIPLLDNVTIYTITDAYYNNVYAVYGEDGKELALNNQDDPLSVLTPSYNTVQVPNPITGTSIYVIYSASPTALVWATPLSSITVPLPSSMLEALLHYVGYRAHGAMNGNVDAENNTHYMRFDASCNKLKEIGMFTDDALTSGTKLEDKGWA
jgi:hypothetical protein